MKCRNAGVRLACLAGTLATTTAIVATSTAIVAANSSAAVSAAKQAAAVSAAKRSAAVSAAKRSAAVSAAKQAAAGPMVKVRIEGAQRTLLAQTPVIVHAGYITRMGAPAAVCSATSAAGALQAATHGNWSGTWSTSFNDYFVKVILGDNESGKKSYWDVLVNHVAASTGICGIHVHDGEQLLFAAVPSAGPGYPLAVRLLSKPTVGHPFRVEVVYYDAKGVARPMSGVRVVATAAAGGSRHVVISPKTGAAGKATMTESTVGRIQLEAAKHGYIRSSVVITQVKQPGG